MPTVILARTLPFHVVSSLGNIAIGQHLDNYGRHWGCRRRFFAFASPATPP
ncbi:hypothetical protein V5O48_013015 [Marasmius crinis-equi]|uniref:Uncharacterized protein n=1 Tax=Marasmius crinis-equi TaxID=585013 RepID=A0ABR3F184_9AGAR